jgi:hypothetical protein
MNLTTNENNLGNDMQLREELLQECCSNCRDWDTRKAANEVADRTRANLEAQGPGCILETQPELSI